jgi:hypothetical protein
MVGGSLLPGGIAELASAIGGSVVVMLIMMIGSGIGEEIAGFFFKKVQGGVIQMIYLAFYMPLFIIGGYVYSILKIPGTSLVATSLFFALWGIFTVFVARFLITIVVKIMSINVFSSHKMPVNGAEFVKYLKGKSVSDKDTEAILVSSCDSEGKARKLARGGFDWVEISPEDVCYELTKRGFDIHDVMELLTGVFRMKPEEAAMVWKKASV